MQVKKILMPTDFSVGAGKALDQAILLAREHEAELHILHVVVLHGEDPSHAELMFPDFEAVYRRLEERASDEMRRLLQDRQNESVVCRQAQLRAIAAGPAILDYAVEQDIDLIVIGTHGRRGLRRFLLGSVTEEVVRRASCPVWALHQDVELHPIRRIVVPYDFSEDSEWALATANDLAAAHGGHIDLVHVLAPPITVGGMAGVPLPGPSHIELVGEVERALGKRVEADSGVPIELHVLEGSPASQITDLAESKNADLIVIGSHGQTGLRRFLLGSVSEGVVRAASCPVLVMRRTSAEDASQEDEAHSA